MSLRAICIYHIPTITTGISADIFKLEDFFFFTYDRHRWLWLVSIHQDHFHYVWITHKSDSRSVAYGSFSDMKEDKNGKMKNWSDKVVWKVSDVQSLNSLLNSMISLQKSCGLEDTACTQQMISKYTSFQKIQSVFTSEHFKMS